MQLMSSYDVAVVQVYYGLWVKRNKQTRRKQCKQAVAQVAADFYDPSGQPKTPSGVKVLKRGGDHLQ